MVQGTAACLPITFFHILQEIVSTVLTCCQALTKPGGSSAALFPLNCFRGLQTRMGAGFLYMDHLTLPSYLPSKNKRFDWRGRCTRFAWRLLFDINHQLLTGAGSPSEPLHPTFFLQGTSIKQRLLITKRYIASVLQSLVTFYAQFIFHKDTNLPFSIICGWLGARTRVSTIRPCFKEEALRQHGRSDIVHVLGRHAASEEALAPLARDCHDLVDFPAGLFG